MAEPHSAAPARFVVSVVAVATTLGGSLAMAVYDRPPASATTLDATSLSPLPTLEPAPEGPPVPARRPIPIATTRSSR